MATGLGEILIKKGYINSEQLEQALRESRKTGEILGKTLIRLRFVTEEQLLKGLSEQLDISYYPSLKEISVSPEVIKAVPIRFVQHYKFMPLELKGNILIIAVSNPLDIWPQEEIKLNLGYEVERVLSKEEEIEEAIRKYYGIGAETIEKILEKDTAKTQAEFKQKQVVSVEDIERSAETASVIKLVNQILTEAIQSRATDIHIESYRDKVRLRYRIDGVLYDVKVSEDIKYLHPAIVSRIKIISHLDVVERRLPQDGRVEVKLTNKPVDLRISIIPAQFGENVVIRILPKQLLFNLEDLGLFPDDLKIIEGVIKKPHGIILLTGPTGSGKTTTLYACLTRLNNPQVKIITIEDPIEYELEDITQIQVNPKINFTFANTLRSTLRHDPDIMMVGEIRDLETAELAIRTALTGHLVFSTLHTNDACSGIARLLDIGIEPYLLASSVEVFIAQRLLRVICPECKKEVIGQRLPFGNVERIYRGKGCEACKFTGFKGRTAIYEIILVNDQIRKMIINRSSSTQIKKKAIELGMRTLSEVGWEKVRRGITTPEEVMRVVELEEYELTSRESPESVVTVGKDVKMKRRFFPRIAKELPIECNLLKDSKNGTSPFSCVASTRNISAGGLLFETKRLFPQGSIIQIKIRLPSKKEDIVCLAEILRMEKATDGQGYRVAVSFISIKESDRDEINQYVHQELEKSGVNAH